MKSWPPAFSQLLATKGDSAESQYAEDIRAELETDAPYFRDLSEDEKRLICSVVVTLDSIAATSIGRIQLPLDALQRLPPLKGPKVKKRDAKAWQADQADLEAVNAAYRARRAILEGDFITALQDALEAGMLSRARSAEIGSSVSRALPKKGGPAPRNEKREHRDNWIVKRGQELYQQHPEMNESALARLIVNTRKRHDPNPGSPQTVRKVLARHRELVRQGLPNQP